MESFPELKPNHVVLLRADKKTGHVLDEKLFLALEENQKTFTLFESLDEAKVFAQNLLSNNPEIELVIYSNKEDVLFYSNE